MKYVSELSIEIMKMRCNSELSESAASIKMHKTMKHIHFSRPFLLIALMLTVAACDRGPEQIHYGSDECAYCRMMISEPGYGSQLVTTHGLAYKFDSVECLAAFEITGGVDREYIHSKWVTDFSASTGWIPAGQAFYLHSETLRSPMGLSISAFATNDQANLHQQQYRGSVIGWDDVKEIVKKEWSLQHSVR
jgi:copper chaperone NosL